MEIEHRAQTYPAVDAHAIVMRPAGVEVHRRGDAIGRQNRRKEPVQGIRRQPNAAILDADKKGRVQISTDLEPDTGADCCRIDGDDGRRYERLPLTCRGGRSQGKLEGGIRRPRHRRVLHACQNLRTASRTKKQRQTSLQLSGGG